MHRQTVLCARVTTNIVGGLGNQLFLVSNLLATARRSKVPAVLPRAAVSSSSEEPRPTYWDSLFANLPQFGVEMVSEDDEQFLRQLTNHSVVVPERRPVSPIVLDRERRDCLYNLVGFFQSERFFADEPIIHDVVPQRLHELATEELRTHFSGLSGPATHRVALHVRRGDYVRLPNVFAQLGVEDYYDAAVRQLLGGLLQRSAGPDTVALLVFCEERDAGAEVCRFFQQRYRGVTVHHVGGDGDSRQGGSAAVRDKSHVPREVLELLMMAHCDDVVMANSTFSWWGAYLNRQPLRRVVAPSRWFTQHPYPQSNHLYCADWLLL